MIVYICIFGGTIHLLSLTLTKRKKIEVGPQNFNCTKLTLEFIKNHKIVIHLLQENQIDS
jgi:hypothetical protein